MAHLTRRELVLLFLGDEETGEKGVGIDGITRLQKLLFLLEHEAQLKPTNEGFSFEPYKAGPYSPTLYDDLELLNNLGFIESEGSGQVTDEEAAEVDLLEFDELMGDTSVAADAYEERRFRLTDAGLEKVKVIKEREGSQTVVDGIRRIKSKYSHYSLLDLLSIVYQRYPEMTTESEIKDKVLRRKRPM